MSDLDALAAKFGGVDTQPVAPAAAKPDYDALAAKFAEPASKTQQVLDFVKTHGLSALKDMGEGVMGMLQGAAGTGMGEISGAAGIGSNLLSRVSDTNNNLTSKIDSPTLRTLVAAKPPASSVGSTDERNASINSFFNENTDTSAPAFKIGKVGAEVAGTAGVGGALAQGVKAFPILANFLPKVAPALESGGFSLGAPAAATAAGKVGDVLTRMGAGAAVGATSAGLINPDDAGTGAVIGAALPTLIKGAGAIGKALGGSGASALEQSQNAVRDAVLKAGQDAGYVVPPSTVNPNFVNQTLESVGGKAAVGQAASIQNQKVTNSLARQALGLPESTPISEQVLNDFRTTVSAPYKEVAALPTMPPQRTSGIGGYPLFGPAQQAPAEVLHDLQQARFDANAYWNEYRRTGEVAARDKATALGSKADSLESYLEQTAIAAGKPELVNALRAARQAIAKSYSVEGALNTSTGDVSSKDLAKMLYQGKPLSGPLATAARFADAFPKANQDVASIGSQNVSKVAATVASLLAGGGMATAGPAGAMAGALPFIVPSLASKAVLSKGYQGAMATPGGPAATIGRLSELAGKPLIRAPLYVPNQSNP